MFIGPLDACVFSVQVLCERLDVCCFDHCERVINSKIGREKKVFSNTLHVCLNTFSSKLLLFHFNGAAPHRYPIHLKDEVKPELDQMEELEFITKVSAPTDWVSSIVYNHKSNNKVRIYLDPKDLNRAIKRPHYKTPTLDEITHQLAGSRVFSKLDARRIYWSVSLEEPSGYFTTFNSPFGRCRFEYIPVGLNVSQ